MFTLIFWRDAAERSIATAAQSAVAAMAGDGLGLLDVDAAAVASVAGLAALLAVLKALAASYFGDRQSASLVDTPGQHAADRDGDR